MRPLTERTAAVAGLFALLAVVYWPLLLFPSRFVWFDHYDLSQLQIPRLQFFARSLHAGHFPLWNPYVWLGQPVLGSGQPGPLNPLVLLFARFLPLRDAALSFAELNWLYFALHLIAALLAYWFCRYLALPVLPSLLGAVAFSCTGFLGSAPWLDIGSGVALTPLIFYYAFRLWTEGGILANGAPLGLALGLSWWTGHHEIPLITGCAVLFGSVCVAAASRTWRAIHGTLLAFALAIPMSAIQTLPFYEFGHASRRWVGVANPIGWSDKVPYEVHARYSLPWLGLAEFFAPGGVPEGHWTAFAGVTILVLAIAALVYRWSDRRVKLLGFLALGSLLYALGSHTPFQRLIYELLPLADKARSPGRGIFLAGFALSALAAVGADLVIRGSIPRKGILIPAAVAAMVLVVSWSGRMPEMEGPVQSYFVVKGLIAAFALGVLIGGRFAVWPGIVLLALILMEAGTVAAHRMTDLDSGSAVLAPSLRKYASLAKTLPPSGQGRIVSDYNSIMTDLGDLYGVDVLQSFVSAVPEHLLRFEFQTARTQQLLGVTSVPNAMPRAWIVHRVIRAKDVDDLRRSIEDPAVNFATTAVTLEAPPPLEECSDAGVVSFDRPDSDTMRINTDLRCRGLLILSETFYPGWEATVDGRPQPIYEVFGALRGVVLESGSHRVEMRYRPAVAGMGAALSFSSMAVGLVLIVRSKRKNARAI
ncbi:MAG TPA: YfhO family protein [Bryobacteraceae bacterium]|nr:YfhO family protein [Bryobacteraceae bacterium]